MMRIESLEKASGRVKFDFWPCMRQMTHRWGCSQVLSRLIESVGKPDICFGKTDGIPSDIPTVDRNPDVNPTHCLDWKDLPFNENQFNFGFWDPPYDKLYMKELREIWRVCKRLAILHQLVYQKPHNAKRTHMIAVTTGPRMRIRCLQVFEKISRSLDEFREGMSLPIVVIHTYACTDSNNFNMRLKGA